MHSKFIARFGLSVCATLFFQLGPVLADQNISSIEQIGSGNSVTVAQHGALDTDNNAQIKQSGDEHIAEIRQNGTGLENDASIFQTGLGHTASIYQSGFGGMNTAIISQNGETNNAQITQQALLFGPNPNMAKITQSGIGNEAEIDQTGNNHDAEIRQTGDYNGGTIMQNDKSQKAYLEQNGDNLSHPTITQYGAGAEVIVIQTQ